MPGELMKFEWNASTRTWACGMSANPAVGFRGADLALEVNGRRLRARDADSAKFAAAAAGGTLVLVFGVGLRWTLEFVLADAGDYLRVNSQLVNDGAGDLRIGKVWLIAVDPAAGGAFALGADASTLAFLTFRARNNCHDVRYVGEADDGLKAQIVGQTVDTTTGYALNTSFVTFSRAAGEHLIGLETNGAVRFESVLHYRDFPLPAGEGLALEQLHVELGRDPHAALEHWAELAADRCRPKIRARPATGWVNAAAWVDCFHDELAEDTVIRNTRAIARRLAGFEVEYIWVSIFNLKDALPGNWLDWNEGHFPHGVEWLVNRITDAELKLGLWIGPFWVSQSIEEQWQENRDNLLMMADGQPYVDTRQWGFGTTFGELPFGERPNFHCLDGSHPHTHEYLRHVFEVYRQWGIRYYMLDFLSSGAGIACEDVHPYERHHDRAMVSGMEVYRKTLEVIRNAVGPDTYLLASTGPTVGSAPYVDAVRIGPDYGEGRQVSPVWESYPATYLINGPSYHYPSSDAMAGHYFTHGKLFHNDLNIMTVDCPVPLNDARITTTLFGISGGPLMIGDDVDTMSEARLALIKKCLPRTDRVARPLDLFRSVQPHDHPHVFCLPVETTWDRWEMLAVFNYETTPRTEKVGHADLGLAPGEKIVVWDFWNEAYVHQQDDPLTVYVAPNSVTLLRVSKRRPHPWVAATNMHITSGQVEINAVRWDDNRSTLSLRASRPAGETGYVYVVAPAGFRVVNMLDCHVAKDAVDDTLVISRRVTFQADEEGVEFRFARYAVPS